MAKKWLKTAVRSDVDACNQTPYGYPSPGTPLSGGVVAYEAGGVGWTVEQFPVEESGTGTNYVVEVDDAKVPPGLVSKLLTSKPPVK